MFRFGYRLGELQKTRGARGHSAKPGSITKMSFRRMSGQERSFAFRSGTSQAFTLIEVVLALGVFSFAVLSLVGTLGVGLDAVSTSNNSFAIANITRSLRANYQNTLYSTVVGTTTPPTTYFTSAGYPTTLSSATNANDPVYYTVTCTSATTNQASTSLMSSQNAAVVAVNVSYPYPANAHSSAFSLFLAQ